MKLLSGAGLLLAGILGLGVWSTAFAETVQYQSAPLLGGVAQEKNSLALKVTLEGNPEATSYTLSVVQGTETPPVILEVQEQDSRAKETRLYTGVSAEKQAFTLQIREMAALLTIANPDGKTGSFFLLQDGISAPQLPVYIQPPISGKTSSLSTLSFIDAYPFWSGDAVSLGYTLLPVSHRVFLRHFPTLRADIAWKVCQAKRPSAGTFALLEGQKLDCPTLLSRVDGLQKNGKWTQFKITTRKEAAAFKEIVNCGQGMKDPAQCSQIQKLITNKNTLTKTIFEVTK